MHHKATLDLWTLASYFKIFWMLDPGRSLYLRYIVLNSHAICDYVRGCLFLYICKYPCACVAEWPNVASAQIWLKIFYNRKKNQWDLWHYQERVSTLGFRTKEAVQWLTVLLNPPNPNMLSWNKGHTGTFSLLSSFIIHSETLFTQFLWRNMTYSFLLLFMLLSSTLWIVLNSIILVRVCSFFLFPYTPTLKWERLLWMWFVL